MRDPILDDFDQLRRTRPEVVLAAGARHRWSADDVAGFAAVVDVLLERARLPRGAVVGMAAPDGPGFLSLLIALRRRGLVALLIDDWSPRAERLRTAVALGASALLQCRRAWPDGPSDVLLEPLPGDRLEALAPGCAVIKLTSGSTGVPRGVATPAEALAADDEQLFRTMGLHTLDRLLAAVPLGHSYGLSSLAIPAVRRGVPLIFPEPGSPFAPLRAAAEFGATFFPTTPAWLHGLLRLADPPAWPESLRLTISAGAPLGAETAERFRRAFGTAVHTFYGSSECGGICYDRDGGAAERGTVGEPVEGVRVVLEDLPGDTGGDVRAIHVHSRAVAQGYVPTPDPVRLGGGCFVAGDLGSWRRGELALAGRVDDLINVHGKKVSPREVERILLELPGVEEVAVVGLPQPGTGGEVVRAVVAADAAALTVCEILAHCRERLTPHKVPRSVVIVDELPRTPRGKLDRAALRNAAAGAGLPAVE